MPRKQITKDQFLLARTYIYTDIFRELQLASASQSSDSSATIATLNPD